MTERPEAPVLSLERAAVCLHFVERGQPTAREPYPDCPVLRSMELDLLSYQYQAGPPFGSQCAATGPLAVDILFPERVVYNSEGRETTLICSDPVRAARVLVSSTRFLLSGGRVWHVAIAPAEGTCFTEFDIIKLIHLYDGRAENTGLAGLVKFRCADGSEVGVSDLLSKLAPEASPDAVLKAGTVEIITASEAPDAITVTGLLGTLHRAREADGAAEYARLAEWLQNSNPTGKAIMAYCGVVSGIFDFEKMDAAEVLDTLESIFPNTTFIFSVHRCTLALIADADRALEECRSTVGISPYLLIPHAVLLHNEALVDDACDTIEAATSRASHELQQLEEAREHAERNLSRFYVPNVFNYLTERTLYEQGAELRGSKDKLAFTRNRLVELKAQIDSLWQQRRDRGQLAIAVLLAMLSVLQSKDSIFALTAGILSPLWQWVALTSLGVLLAALIVHFWGAWRSA